MRSHHILIGTLTTTLLLLGCSKQEQAAPQAEAQPTEQTAPAAVQQAAPETYGVANFAGEFTGTLPCADCPGIDTTLTLRNDGSYLLHSAYQERDSAFDDKGVWQVEQEQQRIQLQPENKTDPASYYQIVSKDELKMMDGEGKPVDSPLNYSLKRKAQ